MHDGQQQLANDVVDQVDAGVQLQTNMRRQDVLVKVEPNLLGDEHQVVERLDALHHLGLVEDDLDKLAPFRVNSNTQHVPVTQ